MSIIGIEIKEGFTLRACNCCKKVYYADNRNLKRGWGLACSKRCAAKLRERSKPGYNALTVAINNERRALSNPALIIYFLSLPSPALARSPFLTHQSRFATPARQAAAQLL